jgi:hypothetical protein
LGKRKEEKTREKRRERVARKVKKGHRGEESRPRAILHTYIERAQEGERASERAEQGEREPKKDQ